MWAKVPGRALSRHGALLAKLQPVAARADAITVSPTSRIGCLSRSSLPCSSHSLQRSSIQSLRLFSDAAKPATDGASKAPGADSAKDAPVGEAHGTVASEGATAGTYVDDAAQSAAGTETPEAGEGGSEEQGLDKVVGSGVLWRSRDLQLEFSEAQLVLGRSGFVSGAGIFSALFGIAPFTPPLPFNVALLLGTLQVSLLHAWQSRQLRAHGRRHVVELSAETEEDGSVIVSVTCGLGTSRKLTLIAPQGADSKPPFKEVMRVGTPFVFLDRKLGSSEAPTSLDALLSSDWIIKSEDLDVTRFEDESEQEIQRVVQKLDVLTKKDLKTIEAKMAASSRLLAAIPEGTAAPTVTQSMDQIVRASQMLGAIILIGGAFICIGGRMSEASP